MTELADVRCQSACTCHSADASVVPWCGDLLRNSRSVPGELSAIRKLHRAWPKRDRRYVVITDRLCGIERLPTDAPSRRGPEPRAARR
jgi:hypothetical protein